ncbi:DUF1758 domain-containing protein [Caerostris extrusa]|uniref:DUF1758 domain-containing protein n=1 Tax=Caerostris extrusa TaxID=172846 RepID=A0AAV4PI80_CAEEX|nr:DUF1758 domain-containing protein [Caerostris extrusa]
MLLCLCFAQCFLCVKLICFVSHSAPGQKGPVIEGNLPWYHVGDLVNLTCSSAKSPIPVHIRWFVNDMEAKMEHLIKYPTIRYSDGTEVSSLGLRMKVESYHFKSDELRIKCTTTLYRMLTMRAEKTLFRYNQQNSGFHTAENRCAGVIAILLQSCAKPDKGRGRMRAETCLFRHPNRFDGNRI